MDKYQHSNECNKGVVVIVEQLYRQLCNSAVVIRPRTAR
jgi:hypothetical protein